MTDITLQLSDEQLASILADGRERLIDAAEKAVLEQLTWKLRDEVVKQLQPIISAFIQDEIAPELAELLAGQKSIILDQVVIQANEIGTIFVKSLVTQLAENMGTSYKRKGLFEAIFK